MAFNTEEFRRQGYLHLPALVPPTLVEAARAKILLDVEKHFDPTRLTEYNNRSWCPDLRGSREIQRLFQNKAVRAIADEALGRKQYVYDSGQIAIRQARNAQQASPPVAHIDGIPTPHNGVPGTAIQNFTALLGVFLTDVKRDFAGNFTVWPGSHLILEEYFREYGRTALENGMPNLPLGDPVQLHCQPGDVVFCHYQLAHAAAANISPDDRTAIFFRLWFNDISGPDRSEQRWHNLTHIWDGWRV